MNLEDSLQTFGLVSGFALLTIAELANYKILKSEISFMNSNLDLANESSYQHFKKSNDQTIPITPVTYFLKKKHKETLQKFYNHSANYSKN